MEDEQQNGRIQEKLKNKQELKEQTKQNKGYAMNGNVKCLMKVSMKINGGKVF